MNMINLERWPSAGLFFLAGGAGATLAFLTINLLSRATASLAFLTEYGWLAIQHGALWQVGELLIWGSLVLASWLLFKVCENILTARYLAWARRGAQLPTTESATQSEVQSSPETSQPK